MTCHDSNLQERDILFFTCLTHTHTHCTYINWGVSGHRNKPWKLIPSAYNLLRVGHHLAATNHVPAWWIVANKFLWIHDLRPLFSAASICTPVTPAVESHFSNFHIVKLWSRFENVLKLLNAPQIDTVPRTLQFFNLPSHSQLHHFLRLKLIHYSWEPRNYIVALFKSSRQLIKQRLWILVAPQQHCSCTWYRAWYSVQTS